MARMHAEGKQRAMALAVMRTVAEQIPELDPGSRRRLAPVVAQYALPTLQGLCRCAAPAIATMHEAQVHHPSGCRNA